MKRNQLKFVAGGAVIVFILGYLGFVGFQESKAYFYTVSELYASPAKFQDRRLKVEGDVVPGTIAREGQAVRFVITHENQTLPVNYIGTDPLPDTFRDHSTAVVDGKLEANGTFTAHKLQAKCASKYEKETAAGVIPKGPKTEN